MRGAKARRLPGAHDPDSLASFTERYLMALAVKGQAHDTLKDRRRALGLFVVWAAERGLMEPREITKPILERYQRHLFYYRKADGQPLPFRTQGQWLSPIKALFRWLARENYILSNPASEGTPQGLLHGRR